MTVDGLRQAVGAIVFAPGAGRLRCGPVPARDAGLHVERGQAAGGIRGLRQRTGDGDIQIAVIRGAAPGHAAGMAGHSRAHGHRTLAAGGARGARSARIADTGLPENLAAMIGIEAVHHA